MPYRLLPVVWPFALAYFLSYVLRTANAVLSAPLTEELSLSASELGLLSSAYFFTFAALQIPLGALLDRYGPRIVEGVLLVFAIAGCVITALASDFWVLWFGRALIGIGVSACLMASYKAFRICFEAERQPSLASLMLMVGSFGALASTLPVELLLAQFGWRGIFWFAAFLLLIASVSILLLLPAMPKPKPIETPFWADTLAGARLVFAHPEIRRLIPFAIFTHGGFLAIQSLWMGPWFRIVDGYSPTDAASALLLLGVVVMFSHMAMSWAGNQIGRWGITLDRAILVGTTIMLILSVCAVFNLWGFSLLSWSVMIVTTAIVGFTYAKVSLTFSADMAGRASTAINFVVFIGAFGMQWGIGVLADLFLAIGFSDAESLRQAFLVWVIAQAFSLLWMWIRQPKANQLPA